MKFRIEPEYIFLFVVFTALLFFGLGNLWGHKLSNPAPTGYHASDAFQHQTRALAIKDVGTYVYEPPWIVAGYTDIIGFYPPGLYYLSIALSFVSGLEVYDTIYFAAFLFGILGALTFYHIIKKFNKPVALMSLPLSILIFTGISMVGFTWGAIPSLTAQVLMILTMWVLANVDLKLSWLFLGIALSATVLTHSSELVIAGGFMLFYFIVTLGIHFILKQSKLIQARNMILGGIVFITISWYFILIAQLVWAKLYPFDPRDVWITHGGYPDIFNLSNFGVFQYIIIGGMLAGCYLLWKNKENPPLAILAGFYMLFIGYGNFYGLNYKAFQMRYLWPIYLSVFLGIGFYFLMNLVVKRGQQQIAIVIGIILLILFSGLFPIPNVPQYKILEGQPLDQYHWDVFAWIRENTPKDAVLYFFYGDLYKSNAVLRNTERIHYQVLSHSNPDNTADFLTKLQQGIITRNYDSALLGDCCGAAYPYWKGFANIGFRFQELNRSYFYKPTDICMMDYYIFDKVASQPALAQYNLAIANEMMKSGHFRVVHENPYSVILKNDKPGENCIGNATA
ncbi:MAG: hypothetical protein AABX51_00155 [Nanoarchaeota archaeon]|mgnify:CR=1 FL=1